MLGTHSSRWRDSVPAPTAFFANVAELVNAPVLKTGSSRKGLVGSNPTISVNEAFFGASSCLGNEIFT